uniref:Uncharacterized protein n=1 Tax=Polysiphonia sp. TaxID=1967842 RepID=A0A1Z1M3S8_9FLOR|nr:hypothetical protein [Polysiphonia sp.]
MEKLLLTKEMTVRPSLSSFTPKQTIDGYKSNSD